MKIIITILFIAALITLGFSYWISSQEITSETEDQTYNWSPSKITDKATENWKAKEKELEMMNEEFCKENPKLCKG